MNSCWQVDAALRSMMEEVFRMERAVATAGQMVAKTAEIFGMNVSTLESIDRVLVVAGLRHKGGRGRSGARMTARDIAHLAIAAAHDVAMKDAAALVGKITVLRLSVPGFRNLPASDSLLDRLAEGTDWTFVLDRDEVEERMPGAKLLMAEPDLGSVMSRIIDGLAEGAFGGGDVNMTIKFSNQGPRAILLYEADGAQLELPYFTAKQDRETPRINRSCSLDARLLRELARVIHDEPTPVG